MGEPVANTVDSPEPPAAAPRAGADAGTGTPPAAPPGQGGAGGNGAAAPGGAGAPAGVEAALDDVRKSLARLSERFEQKILDDQFKDEQIRRLHAELQEYKKGLLDQALLPVLSQVIRLHENLRRQEQALRRKPPEQLGPERVFKEIAGVRDELEVMLGEAGVAAYEHPSTAYDPGRQIARETVPTQDPALHGTVCDRVLPGYERDGRILFKERVRVYALQPGAAARPAPPGAGQPGAAPPGAAPPAPAPGA